MASLCFRARSQATWKTRKNYQCLTSDDKRVCKKREIRVILGTAFVPLPSLFIARGSLLANK